MDGPFPPAGSGWMYPRAYQFQVVVDNLSLEFGSTFFVPAQAAEFQHTQATYARSHYSFSVALRAGRGLEIAYKRFARSKTATGRPTSLPPDFLSPQALPTYRRLVSHPAWAPVQLVDLLTATSLESRYSHDKTFIGSVKTRFGSVKTRFSPDSSPTGKQAETFSRTPM